MPLTRIYFHLSSIVCSLDDLVMYGNIRESEKALGIENDDYWNKLRRVAEFLEMENGTYGNRPNRLIVCSR
jgi:hypothetical protein